MIVTAHPDDESMASGLISVLVAQGAEVKIVVLTNGDKGTANISITPQDLATIRVRAMTFILAESRDIFNGCTLML
jgi:LmbE family N-acetylglucosaminyl deacetylase